MKLINLAAWVLCLLSLAALCLAIWTDLNDMLFLPLSMGLNLGASGLIQLGRKERRK